MPKQKRIKIAEIHGSNTDGNGGIIVNATDASGTPIVIQLKDERLEALIVFLTATWSESLSKQQAALVPRPFAITGFQIGYLDEGTPLIRIQTLDGLWIDFALYPGGDIEKIARLAQQMMEESVGKISTGSLQ